MSRKIHLYRTESEFEEVYDGEGYVEPWLSYTRQTGDVNYNKTYTINVYGADYTHSYGLDQTFWNDSVSHDPIATYTITDPDDLKSCEWFTGIRDGIGAELIVGSYTYGETFNVENDMSLKGEYPENWYFLTSIYWEDDPFYTPSSFDFQGYSNPQEITDILWDCLSNYLKNNQSMKVVYKVLTPGA